MVMIMSKAEEQKSHPLIVLSGKEAVVLELLLATGRELFGLEMVEASAGLLKRGTIYVTLQRMEEKGLIESRQEARAEGEVGIPRRMYQATGHGIRAFGEHQERHRKFSAALATVGG